MRNKPTLSQKLATIVLLVMYVRDVLNWTTAVLYAVIYGALLFIVTYNVLTNLFCFLTKPCI